MSELSHVNDQASLASLDEMGITPEQALNTFEILARGYYNRNFGTMAKSEIDLVMFQCFENAARRSNSALTDYELSCKLALTPQRIQNFRTKGALRNGFAHDWVDSFLQVLNRGTYEMIDRKGQRGCSMRLMFSSRLDVFAFQDILMKNDIFFDGSFNNLVVTTSLSSVLLVLFKEVEGKDCPKGISEGGLASYLLRKGDVEKLREPVRTQVKALKDEQAHIALSEGSADLLRALAQSLTSGLVASEVSCVGGFLATALDGLLGQAGSLLSKCKEIFGHLEDYKPISITGLE